MLHAVFIKLNKCLIIPFIAAVKIGKLEVEHLSGSCEPSTAKGVNEERMNGLGRRVPATGANSKMAGQAVMGAQWRGVVWHTPYYAFQVSGQKRLMGYERGYSQRSPGTQAMAGKASTTILAAGGLNLAEMKE